MMAEQRLINADSDRREDVGIPFEFLEFFVTNEIFPAPGDLDFDETEIPY